MKELVGICFRGMKNDLLEMFRVLCSIFQNVRRYIYLEILIMINPSKLLESIKCFDPFNYFAVLYFSNFSNGFSYIILLKVNRISLIFRLFFSAAVIHYPENSVVIHEGGKERKRKKSVKFAFRERFSESKRF